MNYIKTLEDLESRTEIDGINERQEMYFDEIDKSNKSFDNPKSFEEQLNIVLDELETMATLKSLGEDVEQSSRIIIESLKKMLAENNKSEEEKQEILNIAYNIIGMEEINKKRSI